MRRRRGSPEDISFGLIGCGDAGRALLRLWRAKRGELASRYGLSFRLTSIATRSHGSVVDPAGIDPNKALRRLEAGRSLADLHGGRTIADTFDFIRRRPARVLVEITPLEPITGQPALDHVRSALQHGIHVVTANKGPVALAYHALRRLADARDCRFRFEATVMDGAPVFNLAECALAGTRVLGFRGILNSTSNLILTEMERGAGFDEALDKARRLGITETDPRYDIDGWDAATKTAVLANVLMGARLRPCRIPRRGIRRIRSADVAAVRREGEALRLVASAVRKGRRISAKVAPERVRQDDALAGVSGTSSALALQTDTMGELILFERDAGVEQTAYGLLSDLIAIGEALRRDG